MLLLLVFAVIAGAGTAITPCVLPVVPALLSASSVGGRRRPIGIVLGLAITFTISIVLLAKLVQGTGLGAGTARTIAVIVLIGFGITLLVPQIAQRIQAPLSRLARFGPRTRGDGFVSGLFVGAAFGFVCLPCAGPILGAVISVSQDMGPTFKVVLTGIAFSVGLAAVMSIYGFGGRAVLNRIRRVAKGDRVERVLGLILFATGVAMAFNLDIRLQSLIDRNASSLPAILVDPTRSLENSAAVQNRLEDLRAPSKYATRARTAHAPAIDARIPAAVGIAGVKTPALKDLGRAPDFQGTQEWFNTPGDRPLSLAQLKGHVVLVDFWTYTCINCIRTLPFVEGLYAHYHRYGLDIVGVETPEFTFEQIAANVRQAIGEDHITYPVVQDNRYKTWDAYDNEYWPAEYLIDGSGELRHTQFGEGNYSQDEAAVRTLLYENGARNLPAPMTARAILPSRELDTPETYLDPRHVAAYEEDFAQPPETGTHVYNQPSRISLNEWALKGHWTASSESIAPAATGASITGEVKAQKVYLVMTSVGNSPRRVQVLVDGKPATAANAGTDVGTDGWLTVRSQRLYNLVSVASDAQFSVTVKIPRGVSAYDFTFG